MKKFEIRFFNGSELKIEMVEAHDIIGAEQKIAYQYPGCSFSDWQEKISEHRGFEIFKKGSSFFARKHRMNYGGGFNTAWSAMTYIDEMLSP